MEKFFLHNNPKKVKVEAIDLLRLVLEILESHFHHTVGQIKSQGQPRLKVIETRFCVSMEGMRDGNIQRGEKLLVIIFSQDLPEYSIFKISLTNKYTHKPSGSSTFLVRPISFSF